MSLRRPSHRRMLVGLVVLVTLPLSTVAAASETPPTDLPVVVRSATWYLNGSLGGGAASTSFVYGKPSDVPLLGDWDGNGTATPGVFRDGAWHLRNHLSAGGANATFSFGRAGDSPLVGDWNGDGRDTIGIVRNGRWHLKHELAGGTGDIIFTYGRVAEGDVPLVGDWDGDGRDTIGIVRNGRWHLKHELAGGTGDIIFTYGRVAEGDIPIVGDWDGDGDGTPGIVRANRWHLRNQLAGGPADVAFGYGATGDLPLVLDQTPRRPVRAGFDSGHALRAATELAEAGPRPAGSSGDVAARRWMARRFEAARWRVTEQHVSLPQGGSTANVIATLPGSTNDGPHLVVGAHLDTVADSPGANDNASGVGVLIALAEELADEAGRLPVDVVLVAFGAEEYQPSDPPRHHVGSDRYASSSADDVVGMISVDMIGNGDQLCICWLDLGPRTMADRLSHTAGRLGLTTTYVDAVPDWSDHGPFSRRGIPAAFLWTGRDANYHSPGDTAEHLRRGDIDRAGDLVLRFIRDLRSGDADGLDRP